MINHKKCSLGTLINEEGLYHTDKKINLSPRTWLLGSFNWETVCSTNCYLFNTEITMRFGNAHIETLLGDSSHCPFKNGNCYLEDKTQIIWPSNSEKNCEYTPIGTWSGQRMGQTWVADKLPLLLDFPEVPKTVRVCDKNLTISNQGFAVHKENKRRIKRAISGIVTSAQLQSELSYLSWKMAQTMRVSFTHSLHAICNHLEEVRRWAISAAFTDPTTFARVIFENPLIHAKRVSSGIIKIWPCASINRDQYEFITHEEINLEKGICFDKIPIKFKAGSVNKIAFIDPSRMEVVADASKAPCFAYRHQIIQLEDETLEIDQMTAQVKKLETTVLNKFNIPIAYYSKDFYSVFHHLVINNVTDFITHTHIASTLKASEITYRIHIKDTETRVTPSESWGQVREEIEKQIFGDWSKIWKGTITILVLIVLGEMLLRIFFILRASYVIEKPLKITIFTNKYPTKLAYLNLSNNQLQKFGSSIKEEFPSIEVLDLSNNQLKIFNSFEWLPSLTFLYLNQNKGINIQINKRKTNFKLIFIQLNNCLLEEMPNFSKFLALRSLELCGNKLTEVPGYLLPINRFLEYDFRNNSLNKLGWDWSETQIERISELKVDGNPLDCACPMPERLIKIVGELEKPKGYICVPISNSSTIYHWQHPLEALDFIQTTSNNFPQNCPSKFSSKIKTETNTSINFFLFLLPILLITVPLIIGILMLLNISNWNDLHWVKTTTKSSMFAYEPLQIKNGNEENNVDNV
uniref:Uncharacterized protein n=2 Tax=Meloidogyne TaxID=189290 RepID=A0A6V7X737_MELEN|nr:unnamed protein product [Meloidogyne enterolobii]